MRKSCKLLLLGTALAATLTVSAGAANFTSCADTLKQMDLFSGTEKGYELDRTPTRAEAAVMLVRLLGGEKDATATVRATPFTDVPNWAAPYVGWLYENKLTAGATATTYDTNGSCTAQMYATFLLRSLGYADTGATPDFLYANAISFAEDKGVVDFANCDTDNFLRDHVVAMSYTALSVQPKDGKNDTLLDQLIASGAVDASKAADAKATFAAFKEYAKLSDASNQITDMAMKVKTTANVKMNGASILDMTMDMDLKANMDLNKLDNSKLSMVGKTTATLDKSLVEEGEPTTQSFDTAAYYTAGNYYVKNADEKTKIPMSFDDVLSGMSLNELQGQQPICVYKSIAKNSDGSYSLSMAPEFVNGLVESVIGQEIDLGSSDSFQLDRFNLTVIPKNGALSAMKADVALTMTMEGQKMSMSMNMDYTITGTGSSVTVTLPSDLNTYQTISAE